MSSLGKVAQHKLETVFGKHVEIQARKVMDGFCGEWSFDGDKWSSVLKTYEHIDDAMANARTGAFIAQVHWNAVNRRKVQ
jgi:hypothetical protein